MRNELELTEHYTMPDGATATIRAYRSPKGVYGAKLELVNGNTLPISIGGTPGKPVRSLVGAMSGAKKFLKSVYGAGGSAGWGTSHLSHVSAPGVRPKRSRKKMKITLSQSDDDDGFVTVYCDDQDACRHDQSIDGNHWETPGDMDVGYASVMDRPTLVAELKKDGYDVDDSDYSRPSKADMERWAAKAGY